MTGFALPRAAGGQPVEANSPDAREARQLLGRFLEPGADLRTLTAALRPTPADYRAVYKEPLASALEARDRELWEGGAEIGPGEGQTELLVVAATTDRLIARDAILDDFPGGYGEILDQLKPGFAIVRFKFVAPGSTTGLAFDGLVKIGGRWVLIPKPWRGRP